MTSAPVLRRVLDSRLVDAPIAVVDVETTGVYPSDRVVELAILRIDPGDPPRMVIDTVIDPLRRVTATHIHGITNADVKGAPKFRQIAPDVQNAVAGCTLVAYNAYFDVRFLHQEFAAIGKRFEPPYICLMNLSAHLRLAAHCSLSRACALHQIVCRNAHAASADAEAAAAIWQLCRASLSSQGYATFRDLWLNCHYAFTKSFFNRPLSTRPSAHRAWQPKASDPTERARRIGDLARADELAQELRWVVAARTELATAASMLERPLSDQARADIAFKLFAAELGLVSAGSQAKLRDWKALRSVVARSART